MVPYILGWLGEKQGRPPVRPGSPPQLSRNTFGTIQPYRGPRGAGAAGRQAGRGQDPASKAAAIALAALAVLILAGSLILYALTRQNLAENGGQDVVIFSTFVTVGLVMANTPAINGE